MTITERRRVNAAEVEILPGIYVKQHRALAVVKAIQIDYPNIKKDMLTAEAQEYWL